jgi:hypothetical protein
MPHWSDEMWALDDKLRALEHALCILKRTLDVYRIVSLNAAEIDGVPYAHEFFVLAQRSALHVFAVGICAAFEKQKNYKLFSLTGVLDAAEQCALDDRRPLQDLIAKYAISSGDKQCVSSPPTIGTIRSIINQFLALHDSDYRQFCDVRNKVFAHYEDLGEDVKLKWLPNYDLMEKLLLFAIDTHSAICTAYLPVGPYPINDDTRAIVSICAVLNALGIANLKVGFGE